MDWNIIDIEISRSGVLSIEIGLAFLVGFALLILAAILLGRFLKVQNWLTDLTLDQAEIGIGSSKVTIRPNHLDKQIAYNIWVELSTRKIGLEIDLENDVILEVYNSWYAFFGKGFSLFCFFTWYLRGIEETILAVFN